MNRMVNGKLVKLTPEEEAEVNARNNPPLNSVREAIIQDVRRERNRILRTTDWRVLSDVPGDKTAIKLLRQKLRDFPDTVTTEIQALTTRKNLKSFIPNWPK